MLIDVSRRPVRLIFEECPGFIVVRSLKIGGKANGLIHRSETDATSGKLQIVTIQPKVVIPRGQNALMETLLTVPHPQPKPDPIRRPIRPFRGFIEPIVAASPVPSRHWREPHDVISGCHDQIVGTTDIWRLNFIFNEGKDGIGLLTLQNETIGAVLFTIQLNLLEYNNQTPMFRVETPLRRHLNTLGTEPGSSLWNALTEDD